ncbi:MAG: hypothetical protein ACLUD2_02665 [Clostridium sp.]
MSHDFDDELERSTERRSRRNPRMRDTAAGVSSGQEGGYASERERWESRQRKRQEAAERELDVMGDSRIHAIPKQPKQESPGKHPAGARDRMCAAVQRGKPQAAVRYGRQQPEERPAETTGAAAVLILDRARQRKSADAVSLP